MFALGVPNSPLVAVGSRAEPLQPSPRRRGMESFVPVIVACAGLLAGCALIDRPATPAESETSFQDQAAAVAKVWKGSDMTTAWTSGFIPLRELVVEPSWSPNGDLKASFGNGWIRSASPLSDTTGRGDIRFADGTSRGQALVPAWHYTVAGLRQPLVRVAVAPPAITSLPQVALPEQARLDGVVSALRLISGTGDGLAFDIGIGACDKDPRGLVSEFPDLIVIGGSVTGPEAGTVCNSMMLSHRVELRTKRPVGTRPIVDALSGRPLLIQPTPTAP